MTPQSNTPPDGDFVRYVERLTSSRLDASVQQSLLSPMKSAPGNTALPASSGPTPTAGTLSDVLKDIRFKTHVQRVVVLWVAAQVLAHFLPGAGFLFFPALVAYAAWVLFCLNRDTSGALFRKMQEFAETAKSGRPGDNYK
jgi:hypothetical protein